MCSNNTTASKTVKISAPFRLNAAQRKVLVDGNLLNIAAPSGRQQGDYLYSATVTLLRENAAVYTTAPVNALDNWEVKFEEYLADLQVGMDELKNAAPQDDEERHNLFLLKKHVVNTLVERVTINKDREIMVEIRLNLFAILDQDAKSEDFATAAYSKRGETYIRKRSSLARPRHRASYG